MRTTSPLMRQLPAIVILAALAGACGNQPKQIHDQGRAPHDRITFLSGQYGSKIYVVEPDGSMLRQLLTIRPRSNSYPAWSPDGTYIAYAELNSNSCQCHSDIYVAQADGSNPVRLTTRGNNGSPSWSPDGDSIAYETTRLGKSSVYVIPARGGQPTAVATLKKDDAGPPQWSPSGDRILFSSVETGALYTVNPDGSHLRRVNAEGQGQAIDVDPTWSPDGQKVAFARIPQRGTECGGAAVMVTSIAAGHPQQLVSPADATRRHLVTTAGPRWSPSGQLIAFSGFVGSMRHRCAAQEAVFVATPSGAGLRRLTPTGFSAESMAWSPDGQSLAVMGGPAGRQIYVLNVRTGASRIIVAKPHPDAGTNVLWQP